MKTNTIYNENCLETMGRMPEDFIDLTVTSPPYDDLRDYKGYTFDFEPIARELFRVTKPGGVVVWVVGDQTINGSETGTSFRQALYFMDCGFRLHDTMIWHKDGCSFPDANRYYNAFEYMFVFSKDAPKSFNQIADRRNKNAGKAKGGTERNRDGTTRPAHGRGKIFATNGPRFNVWRVDTTKSYLRKHHPAIFPEALARDHILSWSNKGDLVYDPFMGSGTTAKCAKILGRDWIGSEIAAEYIPIIKRRVGEKWEAPEIKEGLFAQE